MLFYKTEEIMRLFKERRPSLPAMTMKTQEVESEIGKVATVDREFVIKYKDPVGVDISVSLEEDSRYQCLLRLQPCQDPTLYTIREEVKKKNCLNLNFISFHCPAKYDSFVLNGQNPKIQKKSHISIILWKKRNVFNKITLTKMV